MLPRREIASVEFYPLNLAEDVAKKCAKGWIKLIDEWFETFALLQFFGREIKKLFVIKPHNRKIIVGG